MSLLSSVHWSVTSAGHGVPLAELIWNAALFTMPRTNDEKRLSFCAAFADDRADRRLVVVLDAPAERVGHQVLGEVADHRRPGASAAPRAGSAGPSSRRAVVQRRRRRRPATPLSLMRHAPTTSKFSSARPSGSITLWHDAHAGFLRCSSMRSRTDSDLPPRRRLRLLERRARPAAAAAAAMPSSTSIIHLPRSTGDVRSATDVSIRMLPWPSRPRRFSSASVHAPELLAGDVRDAVVPWRCRSLTNV